MWIRSPIRTGLVDVAVELLWADDVGELLHGGEGLATRLLAQQPPGHAAHQDVQVLAPVPDVGRNRNIDLDWSNRILHMKGIIAL